MLKRIAVFFAVFMVFALFCPNASADYYTGYTLLRYGQTSGEVKNLQLDLQNLGYFRQWATGYFGSITRTSVVAYQRDKKLLVDGLVGHQTARSIKVDRVTQTAKWCLGVPYVWGGTTKSGFDCSGLTQYVFAQNRIYLPRTAAQQYGVGTWVDKSRLLPGDLVFFTTYAAGASHVGVYLGGGQFVHASSGAGKVIVSSLSNTYYAQHYIGAKRMLP